MSWRAAALSGLAFAAVATGARAAEPAEVYVVKKGDTLYGLAQAYFVRPGDYRQVQRLNGVANPRRLAVGKRLKVPARLLRTRVIEARLGAYRGAVQVNLAGRPVPLTPGATLKEGSVVATGANAFVRLDLPDGTRLSIPSQSRVRLGRMIAVEMTGVVRRELSVEAGRLESEVIPLRDPRDSYIVRTPMSVSAVRGTVFRVAYDPATSKAQTEVVEGVVKVDAKSEGTVLAANYGALVTSTGSSGPLRLAPAPTVADPGRIQDEAVVRFSIAAPAAAGGYRARLAADAGFLEVLGETAVDTPQVEFENLPDGVYFLRLAALDDNGLLGAPATYAFERRLNTLATSAPASSIEGGVRRYRFRWEVGGSGKRTYRLQLFRQGETTPVIDEAGLAQQDLTVTQLPPGVYDWRVMSRTFADGRYVEKWSPLERFEIGR